MSSDTAADDEVDGVELPQVLTRYRERVSAWLTLQNLWPWAAVLVLTVLSYTTRTVNVESMRFLSALDPFHLYKNALYVYNHNFHLPLIDYLRFYPVGTTPWFENLGPFYIPTVLYPVAKVFGVSSFLDWAQRFPAVMGALMVPPVYLIGRVLWNRVAGVFAALFMAFNMAVFQRTSVGFFEKEPTAAPFLLLSVAFFIFSWKDSDVKQSWLYGAGSGLCLGIGAVSWGGALFFYYLFPAFVGLVTALFTAKVFFDATYNRGTDYSFFPSLTATFTPIVFLGVGIPAVLNPVKITFSSTAAVVNVAVLFFLWIGYVFTQQEDVDAVTTPAKRLIGAGLIGVALFALSPLYSARLAQYFNTVMNLFSRGSGGGGVMATVAESTTGSSQQIINSLMGGGFSLGGVRFPAWLTSTGTWTFAGVAVLTLSMLVGLYRYLTAESFSDRVHRFFQVDEFAFFLLAWFVLTWFGTVNQAVRILFFVGPPAALLAGYGLWKVFALLRPRLAVIKEGVREEVVDTEFYVEAGKLAAILLLVGVIFFASYGVAQQQGQRGSNLHQYWQESLNWLEENTASNDVILSWWDYGYWFENVANRPAIVDGGNLPRHGGVPRGHRDKPLAELFTSNQLNETHMQWLQDYGADYLLLDGSMVGKYSAVSFIAHEGGPDATSLQTILPMGVQQANIDVEGESQQVPVLTYCFDRAARCQQGSGNRLFIPVQPNETGMRPVASPRIQAGRGQQAFVPRFCMPNGEEITFDVSENVQTVEGCLFYEDDPVKMGRAARRFNLQQGIPAVVRAPPSAADDVLTRLLLQKGADMPMFEVVQDNGFITVWRIRYDRFNETASVSDTPQQLLQGLPQ